MPVNIPVQVLAAEGRLGLSEGGLEQTQIAHGC